MPKKLMPQKKKVNAMNVPPHTWESHPRATTGEANKTLIIAIISIGLIVLLALLLFYNSQFTGKAFYTGVVNTGGITGPANLPEGQQGEYLVNANLGNVETVAFNVTLTIPNNLECVGSPQDVAGWDAQYDVMKDFRCDNNDHKVFLERAAMPPPAVRHTGNIELAKVTFRRIRSGDAVLSFSRFEVLDLNSEDAASIPLRVEQATITSAASSVACVPTTEVCDGIDNNCNAVVDENVCTTITNCGSLSNACTAGQTCTAGRCVGMTITSPAFSNDDVIPEQYTCGTIRTAIGRSPPLMIQNIPAGTQRVLLLLEDLDTDRTPAIPLVHWSTLIPIASGATSLSIPEGGTVAGAVNGINEINRASTYAAPCPPIGTTHRYRFTALAYNNPVQLTALDDQQNIVRYSIASDSSIGEPARLFGHYYPPPEPAPSSSRGGGFSCSSQWSCSSEWSYCNATRQQARSCTDLQRCDTKHLTKMENRSCSACDESWSCSSWSDCRNGQQSRSCNDDHHCGTIVSKPALQKGCTLTPPPSPPPQQVVQQLPPYTSPPAVQQPLPPPLSLWQTYKYYFIGGGSIIVAIMILLMTLLVHYARRSKVVYNLDELKEWVGKERQMGTAEKDIAAILQQQTGWNDAEIQKALLPEAETMPSSASSTLQNR